MLQLGVLKNAADIAAQWERLGWKNPTQWTMINTYKNVLDHGRSYVLGTDMVMILECNAPLKRRGNLVPRDVPGSNHNVIYVTEAPRTPKDIGGRAKNKAHKSWQGPADFLTLFGAGDQWNLSALDGLAPVAQACINLGTYNCICVEKDPEMFLAACENVANTIARNIEQVNFYLLISSSMPRKS